jgi:hypothetical protein
MRKCDMMKRAIRSATTATHKIMIIRLLIFMADVPGIQGCGRSGLLPVQALSRPFHHFTGNSLKKKFPCPDTSFSRAG